MHCLDNKTTKGKIPCEAEIKKLCLKKKAYIKVKLCDVCLACFLKAKQDQAKERSKASNLLSQARCQFPLRSDYSIGGADCSYYQTFLISPHHRGSYIEIP